MIPRAIGLLCILLIALQHAEQARAEDGPVPGGSVEKSVPPVQEAVRVDRLGLFRMFKAREFAKLTAQLEAFQDAFELDPNKEMLVFQATDTFRVKDRGLEPLFAAWIENQRGSFAPYLARAVYRVHLGWDTRGKRFVSETSEEQLGGMADYFEKATGDISQCLKIRPKLVVAHALKINIAMSGGDKALERTSLQDALKICPTCLEVRAWYTLGLTPRWGGSFEEIQQFVKETEPFLAQNPRLKVLGGYIPWELGKRDDHDRDYDAAVRHYDQALSQGDYWWFLRERGTDFVRMKRYQEGLRDINKWLEAKPQSPEALYWRAMIYQALGRSNDALRDISVAYELDQKDPDIEKWYGYLTKQYGRSYQ